MLAVESSEPVGDIGSGSSTGDMGGAPDINVSFGPLAESTFLRMGGVKGDVRVGQRGHGWLFMGWMDGASNRLEAC